MKSPMGIIQCLHYLWAIFVSLLIPVLMGVGVKDDQVFCYPGTYCWRVTHLERADLKYPDWPPLCYNGGHQSPIDLPQADRPLGMAKLYLDMLSYSNTEYYIWNTGHTVQLKPVNLKRHPTKRTTTDEKPEHSEYIFVQAHFHWAENNSFGSEHTIHGQHYSMEMHMVHYNSKYESFSDAAASNDHQALLVIARLFQADDSYPDNHILNQINDNFPMEYETTPTAVMKFDPYDFLPKHKALFYRYLGGLTTPDCFEIVQWDVFLEPIRISTNDMKKFRNCTDVYHHNYHNYRETQHGNIRTIFYLMLYEDYDGLR